MCFICYLFYSPYYSFSTFILYLSCKGSFLFTTFKQCDLTRLCAGSFCWNTNLYWEGPKRNPVEKQLSMTEVVRGCITMAPALRLGEPLLLPCQQRSQLKIDSRGLLLQPVHHLTPSCTAGVPVGPASVSGSLLVPSHFSVSQGCTNGLLLLQIRDCSEGCTIYFLIAFGVWSPSSYVRLRVNFTKSYLSFSFFKLIFMISIILYYHYSAILNSKVSYI